MALLKIKRKSEKHSELIEEEPAIPSVASDQLGITADAASYLRELLHEKGQHLYLRVAVRGGGCSGFSIHYEFTEAVRENDFIFSKDDIGVVIDKKSLAFLGGASLHCRTYLGSRSFVLVNNPNAKQCSCGQSFSL